MHRTPSRHISAALFLMITFVFCTSGSARAAALAWHTFLGGSGDEYGNTIAVDGQGYSYISGYSNGSWGAPVRPYSATADAFVAKIADNGTLVWNTFLGGSASDQGSGIALDADGNVYVSGASSGTWGTPERDYTANNDGFLAKLDGMSGALIWNTFLGGAAHDNIRSLALDGGNIYVTGNSLAAWGSPLNPYTLGNDIFAAKLDSATGDISWSTFFGGTGDDYGNSIAVSGGKIYLAGTSYDTWGAPMRPYASGADAFAAKIADNGTLVWNTFLGGSGNDESGEAITVDAAGNIFVAGYSNADWGSAVQPYSSDSDAFAAKLDNNGALAWNSFLGGSGEDSAEAIAVDAAGNLVLTGYSNASWGTPLQAYSGDYDGIVAQLSPDGELAWNTFLGGTLYDDCYGLALTGSGSLYLTGESNAAWGGSVHAFTGGYDILVAKLILPPSAQADNVLAEPLLTQAALSWSRGSGEKCAVFMKQADNGTAEPENISAYAAGAAFGSGAQIGSTGWFCVYNGTGTSVTVTGLATETAYRVMVCEYSGSAGFEQYNTSAVATNPVSFATFSQLRVIPNKISRLLSIAEPLKVFMLIGESDTVFEKADKPAWDSDAVMQLLKLQLGARIMLDFVLVRPFALTPGDMTVIVGSCAGKVTVK